MALVRVPFYFINFGLIPDRQSFCTYLYYSLSLTLSVLGVSLHKRVPSDEQGVDFLLSTTQARGHRRRGALANDPRTTAIPCMHLQCCVRVCVCVCARACVCVQGDDQCVCIYMRVRVLAPYCSSKRLSTAFVLLYMFVRTLAPDS